jgi:uncharacterized membrane protein YdjX (TVP38/TMEM64 family)
MRYFGAELDAIARRRRRLAADFGDAVANRVSGRYRSRAAPPCLGPEGRTFVGVVGDSSPTRWPRRHVARPPGDVLAPPLPGGELAHRPGASADVLDNFMKPVTRRLMLAGAVIAILIIAGTLVMRSVPETVSALLFILVVMVEVVVAPIPGGAIAYMGAARFGFWQAWPLLYIGNALGTTLVFFLARRVGTPLFRESVSEGTRRRFNCLLQHHLLLWLVYSVPLIPVDVLSVLAGLSSISARKFLTIALTGYLIYTGIVAFLGDFAAEVVGVTEAISGLGVILFGALAWWLWRGRDDDGRFL